MRGYVLAAKVEIPWPIVRYPTIIGIMFLYPFEPYKFAVRTSDAALAPQFISNPASFTFATIGNAKPRIHARPNIYTLLILEQPIRISIDHEIRDIKLI